MNVQHDPHRLRRVGIAGNPVFLGITPTFIAIGLGFLATSHRSNQP